MKPLKPTIDYIVENSLCLSCGICDDSCPTNAIDLHINKGLILPKISEPLCLNKKGCDICYQVCPGKGIDLKNRSYNLFKEEEYKKDTYVGNYQDCYSGFSNNHNIRYHSASGGLLSQFLIYLLEKRIIQGAVITGYKSETPYLPESFIATTKEEIVNGRSSKYCPVSLNGIAKKIKELNGQYVIVGLPCHIEGFRLYEDRYKRFLNNIYGYFAIYCSATQTFNSQEYLFKKYDINPSELQSFAYRDEGCLGSLKAVSKSGYEFKVPYIDYYGPLRSFFKPHRCTLCPDLYGDLADISFGDVYTGEYKKDKIGVNSLIVRSKKFNKLLSQAVADGYITLNNIDVEIVNQSQPMLIHNRHIIKYYLKFEHMLGRVIPKYDVSFGDYSIVKAFISFVAMHIQRQIGKHKALWFIIDWVGILLKKKRKSLR